MEEIASLYSDLDSVAKTHSIDSDNLTEIKKVCANIPFLYPHSIVFLQKIDGRWYVNWNGLLARFDSLLQLSN